MLRTLTLCLSLAAAGGALAQDCAYKAPPQSPDMIKAGEMRKAEGSPFGLLMLMRDITEKEPGNALAWQWRGSAEATSGDLRSAYDSLSKAVDLDPCDPLARITRAGVAERGGVARAAYDDYSAILARDPKNAVALRLRGDLLAGVAEFSAALADYEAALATGSEDVDLLLNHAGMMQEFSRFRDAIVDYDRILKTDNANVEALVARGYARFMLGEFAAAEPDLAAGAKLNPNAAAWTFLARSRLGKADAAERFVADAKNLTRDDWTGIAAQMIKSGAPDEQLVGLAGDDADKLCNVYFYLGELALAKGDRAKARTQFLKGADACPKDPARTNGTLREYVALTEELKRMK